MSKSVQIHIPQPCHESWKNMTPKEQGRFCGSCEKMVVDFTAMSDAALLDYISNNTGQRNCGRFSSDQLNRTLSVTKHKRRYSWVYVWNLLLATFLMTKSYAQGEPQVKKKPEVQLPDASPRIGTFVVKDPKAVPSKEISGTVLSENAAVPVAGATIMVKGTGKGVVTDDKGQFKLMVQNKESITLEISYIGYKTKTVVLNKKKNWSNVKVLLKEDDRALMGDIEIVPVEN